MMKPGEALSWDWYQGTIPNNALIDETAYVETTFSFHLYRSLALVGVSIGKGASAYKGTMFDIGTHGHVSLGNYAMVNGARIVCDAEIKIGDYALISWNVVLMDTYRIPLDPVERRKELGVNCGALMQTNRRVRFISNPTSGLVLTLVSCRA
jgi:hypothetical protein